MTKWRLLLGVGLAAMLSAGCSSILSKANSGWTENEKVQFKWQPNEQVAVIDLAPKTAPPTPVAVAPLVALALDQLVTKAFDTAQAAVEKEVDAHTASYVTSESAVFWKQFVAPNQVTIQAVPNYKGFLVRRTSGGKVVAQAQFDFTFASPVSGGAFTADGGDAFRVTLSKLWYRKSKAKVLGDNFITRIAVFFGLLDRPPALDVKPEVTIKATRVDFASGSVAEYSRSVPLKAAEGVSISGSEIVDWKEAADYPWTAYGEDAAEYFDGSPPAAGSEAAALSSTWSLLKDVDETPWIGALVPSVALGRVWGGSPFTMEVKMTETDSAMSELEKAKDYLVNKRETVEAKVRDALKLEKK